MRLSIGRRLTALEARIKAVGAGGLTDEIQAMSSSERHDLKKFLLHWKAGGKPGEHEFETLKVSAEAAIAAARGRILAS